MSVSPFVGSAPNRIPPSVPDVGMFASVPQRLKEIPHWLVWREEKRNDKPTKVPYDAKRGPAEFHAAVNAPETWADFATAVNAADPLQGSGFNGIGFVLLQTDLVGIDFDGVLEDGVAEPYVLSIIHLLGNPYCEITPSCTGLRVFVEYDKPLPPGNKFAAKKKGVEKYGAEIYAGNGGGRYLTVTGDKFNGGEGIPRVDEPQLSIIHFLISQFGNEKFKRWWTGDSSDYAGDESRLDMALMGFLARQFQDDASKMEQVFGLSVPGHREKWANRADYRERTIKAAIARNPGEVEAASTVEEYETAFSGALEYPRMGNDAISQYARLLTEGTAIPYGHVRECLKNLLAFCLSDATHYPNHERLYLRGWHFNLGPAESGKTTALNIVMDRWSQVLKDLGIWIDKLSSYGSLQYLTKGFEDHQRMMLYVTEGNTLANANEHVGAIFAGLSDLYDQPVISAGSYRNKAAKCVTAKGSCILCFTPED